MGMYAVYFFFLNRWLLFYVDIKFDKKREKLEEI